MLPDALLEILRCPKSKQPFVYFPRGEANDNDAAGFLLCPASGLRYRVEAGVPVLLVEEATAVAPKDIEALIARARVLGLSVPT